MKIAFLGDIALYGKFSLNSSNYVPGYFDDVSDILKSCDYTVGNLETPFVNNGVKAGSKSAYIYSDLINVDILKRLGVSFVNLSNNHMFDFGVEGFKSTVSLLESNGIDWFGCNNKKIFLEGEEKVVFHGYCSFNTNPLGVNEHGDSLNFLNAEDVINKVRHMHGEGYFNVLSIHSGIENVNLPSYEDVLFARYLASDTPCFYYGHHPHVLQGYEQVNESLIAYSLGNFCFDDIYDGRIEEPLVKQTENNKESAIYIIELIDGKIVNYEVIGIYIDDNKLQVNTEHKIESYCEYLKLNKCDYQKERFKQINEVNKRRNSKRDLSWILSRINFSTLERRYDVYKNSECYRKNFGDFLMKIDAGE